MCVNMLGEGFDLPDLKIAALHDKHRSEAVTLQFIGRFTRARSDLGDATVIANVALGDINEPLKALYAEDADWNRLISNIGQSRTEREVRREAVFEGFAVPPERFPLETLSPRMSTVIYKTGGAVWRPELIEEVFPPTSIVEGPAYQSARKPSNPRQEGSGSAEMDDFEGRPKHRIQSLHDSLGRRAGPAVCSLFASQGHA